MAPSFGLTLTRHLADEGEARCCEDMWARLEVTSVQKQVMVPLAEARFRPVC